VYKYPTLCDKKYFDWEKLTLILLKTNIFMSGRRVDYFGMRIALFNVIEEL
jgi:hypothetical protein